MQSDSSFIHSTNALWKELVSSAGLQVKAGKNSRGYDEQIYGEIRQKLFGTEPGDFETLLASHSITVEQLLSTFLTATEPFARMLNRILQLYQKAAASQNSTNIQVSIQTDKMGGKLEFDLQAFTRQVKAIEYAVVTQNMRRWSQNDMGTVVGLLTKPNASQRDTVISDQNIAAWVDAYGKRDHEFPALPAFRRTGIPWLDELLRKLEADLNSFIEKGRQLFGWYGAINFSVKLPPDSADEQWPAELVRQYSHDFWPRWVVVPLEAILEEIRQDPSAPAALQALERVRTFVDALQHVQVTHEQKIEKLLEILRMPVWQKREAMYAVWVCGSVLLDLTYCHIVFHVKDGCLEFPFRPTKIATLQQPERPARLVELWSELRTPSSNLIGRTSAVQPDYRFRVVDGRKEPIDAMVVECKQYKTSNRKKFVEPIVDYATACPLAKVLLCSYGPVRESVLARAREMRPEFSARMEAEGDIRPQGDGEARLRQAVRAGLAPYISTPDSIGWSLKHGVSIELVWYSKNTDLDLHLRQGSCWTNYNSPTGIPGTRYLEDQRGEREPLSREEIRLTLAGDQPYSIFVHRFAGPATLQQTAAKIELFWTGPYPIEVRVPEDKGDWWYVADLRPGFGEPVIINRMIQELPTDAQPSNVV